MFPRRFVPAVVTAVVLLAAIRLKSDAGELITRASCANGSQVSLEWTFAETETPVAYPEWIGYDVYRRPLPGCGPFVRVNAQPFPRMFGTTHSHSLSETPPEPARTYEYRVAPVDASRNEVQLVDGRFSCSPCIRNVWTNCPELSAPMIQGTLVDFIWTLGVSPCAGSCYPSVYLENWSEFKGLAALAGTDTVVHFYGRINCETVEGCGMTVERYEVAPCRGTTPVVRATWGRLKTLYR